jgi:hypothetical protein
MVLEVLLAAVAIAVAAVYCFGWAGIAGGADQAGRSRSRALQLLNADLGEAGRTTARPWRPGTWRALR